VGLLWLGAVALSARCFFEAVMNPFYLGPPFAMILLVAAARSRSWRLPAAFVVTVVATAVASHRLSEWAYWSPMVALLGAGLACAWPGDDALGSPADRGRQDVDVPIGDRLPDPVPAGRTGAARGHGTGASEGRCV
jgi:hypothetical protein